MKIRRPKVFSIMNNIIRNRPYLEMYKSRSNRFSNESFSDRSNSLILDLFELDLALETKLNLKNVPGSVSSMPRKANDLEVETKMDGSKVIANENADLINCDEIDQVSKNVPDKKAILNPFGAPDPKKIKEPIVKSALQTIKDKDMKIINHILEVLRIFNYQLKNKKEFKVVEFTGIDNMECFCYHYSMFSSKMKEFIPSAEFIFNSNITGRSGSILFYTFDFKFAIKTIRKCEIQTAIDYMEIFNSYFKSHESSLIAPIFGIYSTPLCYFIVMKNVFDNPCNEIFDLKGVDVKRKNKNGNLVNVEKDWKGRSMKVEDREKIIGILEADSKFLKSLDLMDYSLLIGISSDENKDFRVFNSRGREKGIFKIANNNLRNSFGIVDILTIYDWKKKVEYIFNKMCCFGNVSCVDPERYSTRFINFLDDVFEEADE